MKDKCTNCKGTGTYQNKECQNCKGFGEVVDKDVNK